MALLKPGNIFMAIMIAPMNGFKGFYLGAMLAMTALVAVPRWGGNPVLIDILLTIVYFFLSALWPIIVFDMRGGAMEQVPEVYGQRETILLFGAGLGIVYMVYRFIMDLRALGPDSGAR